MKKLFILCNGRTGSSFLSDHFPSMDLSDCHNLKQYNAWEFFAMWPPNFWRNIHFLNKIKKKIPDSFVNFMVNLYLQKDGNYNDAKLNDFPYSVDMLKDFCDLLAEYDLKYFVHKHISHANFKGGWCFDDIVSLCDAVIVNYRKSILDCWISNVKAQESKIWISKQYDEKYDEKIWWSATAYRNFAIKYKQRYDEIFKSLNKYNKPYVAIQYEDFCSQENKIDFLKEKLSEIGFSGIELKEAKTIKQSKHREHYEDCFKKYHKNHFKEDYPSIKDLTTYEF